MENKPTFFQQCKDHDSLVHKLLTYGLGIVLVVIAILVSPGIEGTVDPRFGWLIIAFLFYYALMSGRILETLIFGTFIGLGLMYGKDILTGVSDSIFEQMMSEDFVWITLLVGLLGVFCKLLAKAGCTKAFAKIVRKYAKSERSLKVCTWLIQFPLFFDDYMHMTVGGKIMTPLYDEMGVPREDCAFIIQANAMPIRVLFPITSWCAFLAGALESGGVDGMSTFFSTIPFSFYAWVSVIGSLLFALGVIPKLGKMKTPRPDLYLPLDESDDDSVGTLWDFFLPIIAMIVIAAMNEWDLVPALITVMPFMFIYYMIRGIIKTEDVEGCLVEGFSDFMTLFVLFVFSYTLGGVLEGTGYVDHLVEIASNTVNPHLLPFMLFVLFAISEAAMSLNWTLMLIAFPVVLPLAIGIGANVALTAAAVISAGAVGYSFCYIADSTNLTSGSTGLPSNHHAATAVPYVIIFSAITAVLYLVAGFIF